MPRLPTPVATAVTGLVCGLVATLLVWGGERGCDAANPSPYTDDAVIRDDDRVEAAGDPDAVEADDADETRIDQHATTAEDDTAVQRHDGLPRYAPSDDA